MDKYTILNELDNLIYKCKLILDNPIAINLGERKKLSDDIINFLSRSGILSEDRYIDAINTDLPFGETTATYIKKTKNMLEVLQYLRNKVEPQLPKKYNNPINAPDIMEKRDIFICYVVEDRKEIAIPLASAFMNSDISIWFDRYELEWGDNWVEEIEKGLAISRYGIVIISKNFLAKDEGWARKNELSALLNKDNILPIWYGVSDKDVKQKLPTIATRQAISISSASEVSIIVDAVQKKLNKIE